MYKFVNLWNKHKFTTYVDVAVSFFLSFYFISMLIHPILFLFLILLLILVVNILLCIYNSLYFKYKLINFYAK